jgi:transporter family-2 protein
MVQLLIPILAVISGFAITLQGQFMGLLDNALGSKESVFITYVSGGIVAAIASLFGGGLRLHSQTPVPLYAYTSGILGLIIVGTIGFVVPRMGAARGFTLIVASQLLLAALIDQFGMFGAIQRPFDLSRSVGLLVMLTGVWLVTR